MKKKNEAGQKVKKKVKKVKFYDESVLGIKKQNSLLC